MLNCGYCDILLTRPTLLSYIHMHFANLSISLIAHFIDIDWENLPDIVLANFVKLMLIGLVYVVDR